MLTRGELRDYCHELLAVDEFQDYAPNGLQVQGRETINKVVTGVTATQALIERAIEEKADAIMVHHGYFWKDQSPCLVDMQYQRIRLLIENEINLYAYHLPLDAHTELGNNAMLAKMLGIEVKGVSQPSPKSPAILFYGELMQSQTAQQFAAHIQQQLGRTPMVIDAGPKKCLKLAWCTGGAQGFFDAAIAMGVDAYLTGEASEQNAHSAREMGVHFFAAGHHATERYGIKALGEHCAQQFDVEHVFVDIDNPI